MQQSAQICRLSFCARFTEIAVPFEKACLSWSRLSRRRTNDWRDLQDITINSIISLPSLGTVSVWRSAVPLVDTNVQLQVLQVTMTDNERKH